MNKQTVAIGREKLEFNWGVPIQFTSFLLQIQCCTICTRCTSCTIVPVPSLCHQRWVFLWHSQRCLRFWYPWETEDPGHCGFYRHSAWWLLLRGLSNSTILARAGWEDQLEGSIDDQNGKMSKSVLPSSPCFSFRTCHFRQPLCCCFLIGSLLVLLLLLDFLTSTSVL